MSASRPRVNGLGVYAVAYLVFLYLPVAVLPVFSFNDSQYVTFPLKGFTLKWYYQLADSYGLLNALWNSVRVAVSVSILSTVLGIFAAKAVTRYRMRGRGSLIGFIMVPLVIPEIILGISLLMTFSLGGVKLSLITVGHRPSPAVRSVLDAGADLPDGGLRPEHGRSRAGPRRERLGSLLAGDLSHHLFPESWRACC